MAKISKFGPSDQNKISRTAKVKFGQFPCFGPRIRTFGNPELLKNKTKITKPTHALSILLIVLHFTLDRFMRMMRSTQIIENVT